MIATRENLLTEARNIRQTLIGLTENELADAILEVLRYYAPHSCPDDLQSILKESLDDIAETA